MADKPALVLVVDDTPTNLILLEAILEDAGCITEVRDDPESAWAAALDRTPDLVLLDIDLPGMDGYALCRRFKAHPRLAPVPVAFLSSFDNPEAARQAIEAGGEAYLAKPFDPPAVIDLVLALLTKHRTPQAPGR